MQQPVRMRPLTARALVSLVSLCSLACTPENPPADFGIGRLRARVESDVERRRDELKPAIARYGLLYPVEQADLAAALRGVRFHGRGDDLALGTEFVLEPHGGGILRLLLDHWRPEGRKARMTDQFWFEPNGESIALGELYRALRSQVFLPESSKLPRMRMTLPLPSGRQRLVETDAYKTLGLLIECEPDLGRSWLDRSGQTTSVDRLLEAAREHYLSTVDTPGEPEDHSELHLVELLLAYERRRKEPDFEPIQTRFLTVELARTQFDPDDEAVVLGHYTESLGHLVADPGVQWSEAEKARARAWLAELEANRFADLSGLDPNALAHLLRGLRLIDGNRELAPGS